MRVRTCRTREKVSEREGRSNIERKKERKRGVEWSLFTSHFRKNR